MSAADVMTKAIRELAKKMPLEAVLEQASPTEV